MATFIKILNGCLIIALVGFVFFVSAMFYLGNDKTYAKLLHNLPSSFSLRALGGITVGFIGAGLILLINYLLRKATSLQTGRLKKLFWMTIALTSLASILGTIIFFSH